MSRKIMLVLAAAACAFAAGCGKSAPASRVPELQGPVVVTWEFKSADRGDDPYTEAALVINGSQYHRHVIGVFYGRVRRVLKQEEITRELIGGTISGFMTNYKGRGHEVIVRYNEEEQRLIVADRPWNEKLPPGSFSVIKNIPVPEMKKERTGF
jgi:hypothetical protein